MEDLNPNVREGYHSQVTPQEISSSSYPISPNLREGAVEAKMQKKKKYVRVEKEKVKVVMGHDVGMERIEDLMRLASVVRFMGKEVKGVFEIVVGS